ncbi:PGPGW domain-containing protein [Frigoribacterium sp. Leaf172]|uniref:PGPGW domain-containing protein n=1 Tax=Frigoribacterium sp. Leaf172 TaxID=1736285 RepID=UPI0009E66A48|nr:PGPGW domain-containing protein [Frigoribacterium sp. Leaf172]
MTSTAPGASGDPAPIVPTTPLASDGRARDERVRGGRFRASYRRQRARLDAFPRLRWIYKLGVAVVGLLVVGLGLILVPLPGPGWLIVFVGVAVLGTEFPLAHRITLAMRRLARRLHLRWRAWRVARAARSAKPAMR